MIITILADKLLTDNNVYVTNHEATVTG